jgi:hypothetical protein
MERIPELILLPLSKSEAMSVIDALSDRHIRLKEQNAPNYQVDFYERLMSKIVDLLKQSGREEGARGPTIVL